MLRGSLILVVLALSSCLGHAEEIDFVGIVKGSPDLAKAMGLQKLSADEQATLNAILNKTYQKGAESGGGVSSGQPAKQVPGARPHRSGMPVYITKINEDSDDVLKLANGAIVEISSSYLGYVGTYKDAVLYKEGMSWRIWIEGKKSYRCDMIKEPDVRPSGSGELVSVSDVKGDGKILSALGGQIYEVDDMNTLETSMWLAPFEALVLDGSRLMNLDEGGEMVGVSKIR